MKRWIAVLCLVGLATVGRIAPAAAEIYGTMSNFDVYNETGEHCYGAELELEGVHASEIYGTFPAHFDNKSVVEYQSGATFGTRITYSGYNFTTLGYLESVIGTSTNGHACVDMPGCEHFGYSLVGAQPTASRYYWLDQNLQRVGTTPMAVPAADWTYIPPPNGNGAGALRAEVEAPENEFEAQKPDSIWMKVYKTELNRAVDLMELMSDNAIVPDSAGETESEWELLEGGKMKAADDNIGHGKKAVIRRYEYFEYTGAYDDEHEPISDFLDMDLLAPPEGELGQFLSANMVAANLEAPINPQQGDFDGDGSVNGDDFLVWQRHLGDDFSDADEDHSGHVDGNDLAAWRSDFGVAHELFGNAAVPEPGAVLLAVMGGAAVLAQRIRKR